MRFRLGDRYPSEDDAFGFRNHKNIIVDHCSFSWSVDEVLSLYNNQNTTVQWSIARGKHADDDTPKGAARLWRHLGRKQCKLPS